MITRRRTALALMVPGIAWISEKRPVPMLRWLAGALVVLVLVLRLAVRAWRTGEARISRVALSAFALVLAQIALGATTVLTGKAVLPTTAHVAGGAAILGLCWFASLRSRRLLGSPAAAAVALPLGDPALS